MKVRLCSVCGGEVPFDHRTLNARLHYEWRVNTSGTHQTTVPCQGIGKPTEERAP